MNTSNIKFDLECIAPYDGDSCHLNDFLEACEDKIFEYKEITDLQARNLLRLIIQKLRDEAYNLIKFSFVATAYYLSPAVRSFWASFRQQPSKAILGHRNWRLVAPAPHSCFGRALSRHNMLTSLQCSASPFQMVDEFLGTRN